MDAEGNNLAILGLQDLSICRKDKVVFHATADMGVAAFGGDEEVGSALGMQAEIEVHREGGGVEGGAEVGRGRRERQADGTVRRCGTRGHGSGNGIKITE